jgi:hypothetical protein
MEDILHIAVFALKSKLQQRIFLSYDAPWRRLSDSDRRLQSHLAST